MYRKRMISAITVFITMILLAISFNIVAFSAHTGMIAAADYEFEFIDEDDTTEVYAYDTGDDESDIIEFSTNGNSYDDTVYYGADVREKTFDPVKAFIISLIIGLIVAFIAVSIMKSNMKSVYKKQGASDYRKQNGFDLKVKSDTPLGSRIEKSPVIRVENTSQRSSKN
ncbi:hypothetical protein [Ruminococcus sp.]|uniref:hypothetical protein n=1 Tax=Ruminococcus sp. TaxID=41978 RepID=UPI0025EB3ABE|nr:hypothetical protein [Ruminococcus sp.]